MPKEDREEWLIVPRHVLYAGIPSKWVNVFAGPRILHAGEYCSWIDFEKCLFHACNSNIHPLLKFSHGYHLDCMLVWLKDHDKCPMCREEYVKKQRKHKKWIVSWSLKAVVDDHITCTLVPSRISLNVSNVKECKLRTNSQFRCKKCSTIYKIKRIISIH